MIKIYFTAVDNGDGSLGVEFFLKKKSIDLLETIDFERYRGEGGGYFNIPEETILEDLGIEIVAHWQVLDYIKENYNDCV